jgi:hypothetical protein
MTAVEAYKGRPFEWGRTDCVCFAIHCIQAMLGSPVRVPKLSYRSQSEAAEFLKTYRFTDELKKQLGAIEVPLTFAQRGDLIVVEEDGLEKVSVHLGGTFAVPQPGHGLRVLPMNYLLDTIKPPFKVYRFY